MQVWTSGEVEFNNALCSENTAGEHGGCFYSAGKGTITDGTIMQENVADQGGCICEYRVASTGSIEAIESEPLGYPEAHTCTCGISRRFARSAARCLALRLALFKLAHDRKFLENDFLEG